MKSITKIIILFNFFLSLAIQVYAQELTIAVAANVQFTMEEIQKEFTKKTGIPLNTVIGSSGKLTAQINNGAPFDVFLSADMKYPEFLFANKKAVTEPEIYAQGSLVLWTRKDLELMDLVSVLKDERVQKIAIAKPKTAPYGRESLRVLHLHKIFDAIEDKLVYAGSIAQVNQYVDSKVVDIGFTAKSAVLSEKLLGKGAWLEIDPADYMPIDQGVVILKHGLQKYPEESRLFYDFLFSDRAKDIFKKNGYRLP